ncbi:MAG TPA: hypothetical protein VFQ53_24185 [Kofleriaceae bacterium]|nr:hypothetical protein [Kofleriaceae bacterium]
MIGRLALVVGIALSSAAAAAPARTGEVVRIEHRDPTTAPSRGPSTALVTIELFFTPKTNALVRMPAYRALERLQANHPTRIRLIYRVLKRGAQQQISIAVLEAHAQGLFDEFMEALHADKTTQMLGKDKIVELAKKVGMNLPRLEAALTEGRYTEVFDDNDHRLERLAHGTNEPNALFNAKVPRASLGAPSDADLEREYQSAYDRALELLDRGVPQDRLLPAFEDQALRSVQPFIVASGSSDDDYESGEPIDHRLAKPPLELRGLPTFGKPEAKTAIPVVVLCRPNDTACYNLMRTVRRLPEIYEDDVRVVWAPWFDVTRDDTAELTLLGDATLCAEQIGSSDDMNASPGWQWINKQLQHTTNAHGRRIPAEKLIDAVAAELEIDSARLSACRARMANTTLDWIGKARKSGVTRSPAIVIGGRIYEGLTDNNLIQQLIEAELAPGILARCATFGCASE